jgi:hypothetical protein
VPVVFVAGGCLAPDHECPGLRPGTDGGCMSMSRIRLIMLSTTSVLLMLVAGAIVSASSALAEGTACEKLETKDLVVCIEKEGSKKIEEYQNELIGTSDRETFASPVVLKSKVLGLKAKIQCKDFVANGIIEDSNKGKGRGEFLECSFVEPKTCKLSAAQEKIITVKVTGQFVGGGTHQIKFSGNGANGTFVEIEVEGCVKETLKVTGSQKCKLINANTLESLKTVKCETSESELKLDKESAEFEGTIEHNEVLGAETKDSGREGLLWAEAES